MAKCILCGAKATRNVQESASRSIYNCQNCGVFVLSDLVVDEAKRNGNKLAAYFTNRKLAGHNEIVLVSFELAKKDKDYLQLTVDQIASQYPTSFTDQMDLVLENLVRLSEYAGAEIKVENLDMAPVFYLKQTNYDALSFVIKSMHKFELIEVNYYGSSFFPCGVIVSPKGWDRVSQIQAGQVNQSSAMVVHSMTDDEIGRMFRKAARKAAKECGYDVVESSTASSENIVNHEMISMAKGSQFVICDLSHSAGAAYYTVGMASALGKNQVLTCHSKARKKLQVDAEQISVLGWSEEEELYLKILNAIRAQI